MEKKYDVVGIGSPLLDFIVECPDDFLAELGLTKGSMRLIDNTESAYLLNVLAGRTLVVAPGGSSANTVAGVSMLGGSTAFIGKIGDDKLGRTYIEQTTEGGVSACLSPHESAVTGHAITFITPDGERTFATHLGASQYFTEKDIVAEAIAAGKVLHLEGYQLEDPETRNALIRAMVIGQENNTLISIDLADAGIIARNREVITNILDTFIDIVFVNENEAEALTGSGAAEAAHTIAAHCDITVVKVGGGGSYLHTNGELRKIPVYPATVVNTNGAGDAYAAGVLYGITHGTSPLTASHIGSFAASRVVAQKEARVNGASGKEVGDFIAQMSE